MSDVCELIDTTRRIRGDPPLRCPGERQRCHLVGLNMIKTVMNALGAGCRDVTRGALEDALARAANARGNFDCCTPYENHVEDKRAEREALNGVLHGGVIRSSAARTMTKRFVRMMWAVNASLVATGHGASRSVTNAVDMALAALQ